MTSTRSQSQQEGREGGDKKTFFLPNNTSVIAKWKGAFCLAKIQDRREVLECKIALDDKKLGTLKVTQENIEEDDFDIGSKVTVKHPETGAFHTGKILSVRDKSLYKVDFGDGDSLLTRRSNIKLPTRRHFTTVVSLDDFPSFHPEKFNCPVQLASGSRRSESHAETEVVEGDALSHAGQEPESEPEPQPGPSGLSPSGVPASRDATSESSISRRPSPRSQTVDVPEKIQRMAERAGMTDAHLNSLIVARSDTLGNPKGSKSKAASTNEPGTSKNLRHEMKTVYSKQRNNSSTSDDEINQNRSRKAGSSRSKSRGREKKEETRRGKHQPGTGESSPGTSRDAADSRKKEVSKPRKGTDVVAEIPGTSSGVAKKPKVRAVRSQDEDSSVEAAVSESCKNKKKKRRSKGKVEELVDESSKRKKGGASSKSLDESSKPKRKVSNVQNPRLTRQQARIEEQVQENWPFPVGIDENSTVEEKLAEMIRIVDLKKFPPVDLSKPPEVPEKFNFIPNLENVTDPKERVKLVQASIKRLLNCYFSLYGA